MIFVNETSVPQIGCERNFCFLRAVTAFLHRNAAKALVLAIATLLLSCTTAQSKSSSKTFRVMTYNIHHAEGLDGKVDLLRIAQLIKEQGADIVALQEMDKGTERTQRRDFPAELAALTGMTCIFNNNHSFQGGEYGNAVLSRFPVKFWMNTHYEMLREGEQRGLLRLVIEINGRPVTFMNTHLDHRSDDSERWSNVAEIEKTSKQNAGAPVILCGDFNDTPESRVCRKLAETFEDTWKRIGNGDGWTIPAAKPNKRIDYIWISRAKSLAPVRVWVPQSNASDHLPVVAEFELK
jgi:endonuclease/exonuclease/phosphatase family metal-dependent hydrolase